VFEAMPLFKERNYYGYDEDGRTEGCATNMAKGGSVAKKAKK